MKIKLMIILIIAVAFIFSPNVLQASEPIDFFNNHMDILDFSEINSITNGAETAYSINFSDIVARAISGELDLSLSGILNSALRIIFNEIFENIGLLRNLLILCILAALLKNLTDSFENKSVGEVGFYVSYIAVVIILFSSFIATIYILESFTTTLTTFINASIPIITILMVMSGNMTGGYVFSSILYFSTGFITMLIRNFLIPLITIASTLQIVNHLTENGMLKNFSELLKKIIEWTIKSVALVFMGVITLQKISTPILNNLTVRTARSTVNVVPVVGEVLTGAMDTVMSFISASKSGVLVAILITVIAFCVVPIIKLAALYFIYKLVASLVQPISDKRIVSCIDTMGNFTSLLLSCAVTITVMFIFSVTLMLAF